MRKFQLFLLVEAVLLTLGFLSILASQATNFIILVVLLLLMVRFYTQDQKANFFLSVSFLFLFLVLMLNPFIISAIVLALVYVMVNHFAQVKKTNRYALLTFQRTGLKARPIRNQWLGSKEYTGTDTYAFDDINVLRLSGSDVIDLSRVLIAGQANVVIIRKIYGPTKIIVPLDVAVYLDVSALYGSLRYFDQPIYDLRNTSLKLGPDDDNPAHKRRVKLVINVLAGYVEVSRP